MYSVRRTKNFEVSIERLKHGGISISLKNKIERTIDLLASGSKLPTSFQDHKLNGEFKNFRECHIKGDLLLVYKIEKENLILILVNIGSHSKLFN